MSWEIRNVLASFLQISAQLQPAIFHIKRDLNGVTHDRAHQALKTNDLEPIAKDLSMLLSTHQTLQAMYYLRSLSLF